MKAVVLSVLVAHAAAAGLPSRRLQLTSAVACEGDQTLELINENRFCDIMGEPSNVISFEPCCPVPDDETRRLLQGAIPGYEPSCRAAETSLAYCLPENDPPCETPGVEDSMLLNLRITTAPSSQVCCQTCSCKGDPFCTSFSGEKNIEINCDGRRPDTCHMGRRACRISRDRAGNRCLWLKDKAFGDSWSSIDEDGSPCQSDYSVSGYPTMVMYAFEGFEVELTTGERGIILNVTISRGDTSYTLNSARCFEEGNVSKAWIFTDSSGNSQPAASLPMGWIGGPATMSVPNLGDDDPSNDAPTIAEWPWRINDEAGVAIDLVCTRPLNREKLSRIDVLSLIELDVTRRDGTGYCVDNEIPRGESTWQRSLMLHERCTEATLPDLLSTCKALTGVACRPASLAERTADWCDRADTLNTDVVGDIAACKALIVPRSGDSKAKTSERNLAWTRLVCQLNREPDVDDCVATVSQFGWAAYLQTHSDGLPSTDGGNSADTCVDDSRLYGKNTAGSCAHGVSVQYLDPESEEWVESFFVPASKPPCGGQLQLFGDEHPELFANPVRVEQCDLDASCLAENDCLPVVGFSVSMLFSTDFCGAERPDCFNCPNTQPPPSERPQICVVEPSEPTPVGQCETCCTVEDILDVDAFEGQICRDLSFQTQPYCNPVGAFASVCTAPVLSAGNAELALYLQQDHLQISCCATCSTYGDPLGVAFNGDRDKYILCDGRRSPAYACAMSKSVCENQRDQQDRRCVWNASLANLPRPDINVNGSPCQPEDYDGAVVEVYNVAGRLHVEAQLGERAVITALTLTIPEGTYVLDGGACFEEPASEEALGPGLTWTPAAGTSASEESFFMVNPGLSNAEGELTQMITHLDTHIMIRVKCIQSTSSAGVVGGDRIDMQALIDTNETRVTAILNGDPAYTGFCATGFMSEKTKQNANGDKCQRQNVVDAVQVCSALGSPSCLRKEIENEVRAWCSRAALPYGANICVDHVWDDIVRPLNNLDEVADAWVREYCTAVVSRRGPGQTISNFIELCISEVELEGIHDVVAKWGDGTDLPSYCAVDYTAYGPRSGDAFNCVTGISVQTQDPTTFVWEELFFMPDNYLPCDSPFVIPANEDTLPLFTRRVRLYQCDLSQEDCPLLGNEDTHCLENRGFELAYKYSHDAGICPET